jgi:hypothetical protein
MDHPNRPDLRPRTLAVHRITTRTPSKRLLLSSVAGRMMPCRQGCDACAHALDRPYQAEWLADRIGVDAQVRAGAVQSGGADVEGGPLRLVHVLDRHVEVDLGRRV